MKAVCSRHSAETLAQMQILMAQADEWVAGLQPRHAWLLLGPGPPLQGTEAKRAGATVHSGSNWMIAFTVLCDPRQFFNLSVLGILCIRFA